MDAIETRKRDAMEGRITPDRLIDLIVSLQKDNQQLKQELEKARRELEKAAQQIKDLQKKLDASTAAKTDEPYSMKAEEKRTKRHSRRFSIPRRLRGS